MPRHSFMKPLGRIETVTVESRALEGNLCGDPTVRDVAVYLPPGYDETDADYPLFVDLVGFTGSGPKHLAWTFMGESVAQRLDRLVAEGAMGPVVAVFPDCFSSIGGNQYINSAATGRWADFLTGEMIPLLEDRFRVRKGAGHRAVFGKSSGGFGAVYHGLRHGEYWGALACHSGDMGFEWCYMTDFPRTLTMIARNGGCIRAFLDRLREQPKIKSEDMHALMALAMGATYDPDPEAPLGLSLPVDLETCELDADRWRRWLDHDPARLVTRPECQESLRGLRGLYLDCGSRDQYHLQYGNRVFVRHLEAAGIPHRYEEFEDDHSGVDYRMDVSLPFLFEAVTG